MLFESGQVFFHEFPVGLNPKLSGRVKCHSPSLLDLTGPLCPVFFCPDFGGCYLLVALGYVDPYQEHTLCPLP